MIELINQDLGWMEKYQDSEELDRPAIIQPGVARFENGDTATIKMPHSLLLCAGLSMVHQGKYDDGLVENMPPEEILQAAVERFWLAEGWDTSDGRLQKIHLSGVTQWGTLDGLIRWCEDAPALEVRRCPRCKGRRIEPTGERHPDDETMMRGCQKCDGHGVVISNFDAGLANIGVVQVDRRLLLPILRHVRADEVAVGVSKSPVGEWMEAQIRPFIRRDDGKGGVWGDWRIQLDDFTPPENLIQPA